MKHSARTRLTFGYLTIIMAVSLVFSVILYNSSVNEAAYASRRQAATLRGNLLPNRLRPAYDRIRLETFDDFRHNVQQRLVVLNLGMLALGGVLSYALAKRNLEPLEEALEIQARFSSDAAHELRTPLTAMKSEIEVGLRSKSLKPAEARALLASNLEEVIKLEKLTTSLLRLAQSNTATDWKQLRVRPLAAAAVERVAPAAKARNIKISLDFNNDLQVTGDKEQLTELLVILLDNSIKYGKDGMKVTVSARPEHGHVEISVADQGIGIKKADLGHIFERFYRADQARTDGGQQGYGLGLPLAKLIADQHGANIHVVSHPGRGSTFTVIFPGLWG